MTNEEILAGIKERWEQQGSPTITIKEGEPTFDAKEFIESLSYSNSKIPNRTHQS